MVVPMILALFGCIDMSNGGSIIPPGPPAIDYRGIYEGVSDGYRTYAAILDDGSFYAYGGTKDDDPGKMKNQYILSGVLEGFNGSVSSNDAEYVNIDHDGAPLWAAISASYRSKENISGTVMIKSIVNPNSFSLSYDNAYDSSSYISELSDRPYYGFIVTPGRTTVGKVVVDNTGEIKIYGDKEDLSYGCQAEGKVKPRLHGNVYDLRLTFSSNTGCSIPSRKLTGVLYPTDINAGHLIGIATSEDKTINMAIDVSNTDN